MHILVSRKPWEKLSQRFRRLTRSVGVKPASIASLTTSSRNLAAGILHLAELGPKISTPLEQFLPNLLLRLALGRVRNSFEHTSDFIIELGEDCIE